MNRMNEISFFFNIINVFTVASDQFNASLLAGVFSTG